MRWKPRGRTWSQEAAVELVRREGHDALPLGTIAAVILVAEGDAGLVEHNQTPVRDGDPVGMAREIGEHGLGAENGGSIDHEPLRPDGSEVTQKKRDDPRDRRGVPRRRRSRPVAWSSISRVRNRRRKSMPSTRTAGGRRDGKISSAARRARCRRPARSYAHGGGGSVPVPRCVTAVMPMRPPRCFGSAAITSSSSPTPRGTADRRRSPCSARRCPRPRPAA